jgi:DNA-binding NtrC family response regulator
VHREFLLCEGEVIEFGDLARDAPAPAAQSSGPTEDYRTLAFRNAKAKAIEDFERTYVAHILQVAQGNVSAAARIAKKERRAFGKLLKKYSISRTQFR